MAAPKGGGGGKQPIIIKKKKGGGHGGHHGGAWKVAYADFVTAMMAFFLVMWVCGLSESKRRAIAGYFREPGLFSFTTGKALPTEMPVAMELHRGDGSGATKSQRKTEMVELSREARCQMNGTADEKGRFQKLAADIKEQLKQMAAKDKTLNMILGSVSLEITSEGLRIEMADSKDLAYFDVGSAKPRNVMREVLSALAPKLAKLPNQLALEGHTDSRSYGRGAGYTNWELSADRANASRKILIESGVPEPQLAGVTGFADRRLKKAGQPLDDANRRVSIIVRWREQPAGAAPKADNAAPAPEVTPTSTTPRLTPARTTGPNIAPSLGAFPIVREGDAHGGSAPAAADTHHSIH